MIDPTQEDLIKAWKERMRLKAVEEAKQAEEEAQKLRDAEAYQQRRSFSVGGTHKP